MAWTGYNTADELKVFLQPTATWGTSSVPFTLAEIETINKQVYNEINMILAYEGIDTSLLSDSELEVLSLINSYGTASILEKIKYSKVPQRTQEKSQPATDWQLRYKESLEMFLKSKKKKISNSSSFGSYTGSNNTERDPFFTSEDTW